MNTATLAKDLKLTLEQLVEKLAGCEEFRASEVNSFSDLLGKAQTNAIFFTKNVCLKNTTKEDKHEIRTETAKTNG